MRKLILTILIAGLASTASPRACRAADHVRRELVPHATVGEVELVCHRPADLLVLPDRRIAVLNQGSCDVVCFSSDWRELERFGRCGDGPGELSGATGLGFRPGTFYVFRPFRVDRFDAAGAYEGSDNLGAEGLFRPVWWQGQFVGRSAVDLGTVRAWDPATNQTRVLGRNWGMCWVTPWREGGLLVADMLTGKLRVLATDGSVGARWDLGVAAGEVTRENGAQFLRPTLGGVWWSTDCGLLVAVRTDMEREQRPVLRRYAGDDPEVYEYLLFPAELRPSQLVPGAAGCLYVLSSDESIVYEFQLPESGNEEPGD